MFKYVNSKYSLLLLVLIIFCSVPVLAQGNGKKFKVVIDAGHGGKDPGCHGATAKEKDIVLSVALKTGKLISDNCPDVQVIYTRKTDVFVELYRRAEIANSNHADLFISFHCNANDNHSAHGIETWVMGLYKSEANQAVVRAENSAMLKESNYENNYDGFNPNSPEAAIMFSLYSSAYLNNSILLADKVQKNLVNVSKSLNRGVKQGGFWVLYKVAMPSILIEMGFLSNPNDEKYLLNDGNRDDVAKAVYNAFASYYSQMTGNKTEQKDVTDKVKTEKSAENDNANNNSSDKIADKEDKGQKKGALSNPDDVKFVVQFMAVPEKIALSDKRFKNIPKVNRFYENKLWKYTAGNETDLNSAKKVLNEIKQKYPDAFIIAFKGDQKISVSEAQKLLKR